MPLHCHTICALTAVQVVRGQEKSLPEAADKRAKAVAEKWLFCRIKGGNPCACYEPGE